MKDILDLIINGLDMIATASIAYIAYRFSKKSSTQQALNTLKESVKEIDFNLAQRFRPDENMGLELIRAEDEKDKNRTSWEIIYFLNEYEAIASGVNHGLLDEKVVKTARKDALIQAYKIYKPFIDDWREKYPQNPPAWAELERLETKWNKK